MMPMKSNSGCGLLEVLVPRQSCALSTLCHTVHRSTPFVVESRVSKGPL